LHGALHRRHVGAAGAAAHQGRDRRHAELSLVVPHGDLRQLRDDGQRQAQAVVPDLSARAAAGAGAHRGAGAFPDRARPDRQRRGRRVGLHGGGLLLRGVPQARGPGQRGQPEQGQQREGLLPALPLAERGAIMNRKAVVRGPYVRPMQGWWRRDPFFVRYMVREATALAVLAYAIVLMIGVLRLAQGESAWNRWLDALQTPWSMALHLVLLVAFAVHAKSWFD